MLISLFIFSVIRSGNFSCGQVSEKKQYYNSIYVMPPDVKNTHKKSPLIANMQWLYREAKPKAMHPNYFEINYDEKEGFLNGIIPNNFDYYDINTTTMFLNKKIQRLLIKLKRLLSELKRIMIWNSLILSIVHEIEECIKQIELMFNWMNY